MVYNRRHPTEQYRISLKLTSGALRMFFLSPGSKNAYPFWTLEDKITTFLQVCYCIYIRLSSFPLMLAVRRHFRCIHCVLVSPPSQARSRFFAVVYGVRRPRRISKNTGACLDLSLLVSRAFLPVNKYTFPALRMCVGALAPTTILFSGDGSEYVLLVRVPDDHSDIVRLIHLMNRF